MLESAVFPFRKKDTNEDIKLHDQFTGKGDSEKTTKKVINPKFKR